jgi:hypothetical protein
MADGDGGGLLFPLIIGGVVVGYFYRDQLGIAKYYDDAISFLKSKGWWPFPDGGGGCNKTCSTGQHLDAVNCTCIPDTCTKTCPTGQHIDSTCTCVPDTGGGGGGGTLLFAAGGDAGTGRHPEPSVSIAKMVKSKGAGLFVGLGDYPYANVCGGFTPFVGALGGVQAIWAEGNHDTNSCLSVFKQPSWVFRLDKGPCTFCILNGNSFSSSPKQLDDMLKSAPPRKWKFVCFHQPILTPSSSHSPAKDPGISAVMKKYGVQACIQAHNHIYARSTKQSDGVTYFVLGTLGESHYSGSTGGIWVKVDKSNFGATFFNCTDTSCSAQFISTGGKVIDSFTL